MDPPDVGTQSAPDTTAASGDGLLEPVCLGRNPYCLKTEVGFV